MSQHTDIASELPRSPHATLTQIDWAEKARRVGVDPEQLAEPEEVHGPVVDVPQYFHDQAACPGSFRAVDREGPMWVAVCDHCGAEAAVKALAQDSQIRQEARLAAAQLPDLFVRTRLVRDTHNSPVLDSLAQWLGAFDPAYKRGTEDRPHPPGSLLPAPAIYGEQGRGKSLILTKACRRVIEQCDLGVTFYSTRSLLADLQRFDDDVLRGEAWKRATKTDVLALDDLGAERTTDWRLEQLGFLIDERYQAELPILVATNYPPGAWEQILDARSVSRLRQMTFPLELGGPDRRLAQEVPGA